MRRIIALLTVIGTLAVPASVSAASLAQVQHEMLVTMNQVANEAGTTVVHHRFGTCHRYSSEQVACALALNTSENEWLCGVVEVRVEGGVVTSSWSDFSESACRE